MTVRLKALRGEGAKLWKMMSNAESIETLQQGMELAEAFGAPIENLLDGIDVNAGLIVRTSRFQGTLARQPILDMILLHQLSLAPPGSREADLREAVKYLELRAPIIPRMRGFTGLETLKLSLTPLLDANSLKGFDPMPQLSQLEVLAEKKEDQVARLLSLDGLEAPLLHGAKLSNIGLSNIDALEHSTQLEAIDLSKNQKLTSIQGLRASSATLKRLNLQGCGEIKDIDALENSTELTELNIAQCSKITQLLSLNASTKLKHLHVEDCVALTSLEGINTTEITPGYRQGHWFSLKGCRSLENINGMPTLGAGFEILELEDMPALRSLEGLQASGHITTIRIQQVGLRDVSQITCLQGAQQVSISNANELLSVAALGQLPKLQTVSLSEGASLEELPAHWPRSLQKLSLSDFRHVSNLGEMPRGIRHLEIRNCPQVKSLKGIPSDGHLCELGIDQHMTDLSMIADTPVDQVIVHNSTASEHKSWWQQIFADFKRLNLKLTFYRVDDAGFLLELPQLTGLVPPWRLCEEYGLRDEERKTPAEVKTFQRALCKALGVETPDFLKARRVVRTKTSGKGLHLADLKADLLSGEPDKVRVAVERVISEGSSALYDQIIHGVDTENLYSGDSKAIGDFFKKVKAGERPLARWVITTLLAAAPDEAVQSCMVRDSIRVMDLSVPGRGDVPIDGLPLPSLKAFKNLEEITLNGFAIKDLSCLKGCPSAEKVSLKNLLALDSLGGLEELPNLQKLQMTQCPVLASLEGISAVPTLTTMGIDDCPSILEFNFLQHLPNLTKFARRPMDWGPGGIDLAEFGVFTNIDFLSGVTSAPTIDLNLKGSVDLSVFDTLKLVTKVRLNVDTFSLDFTHLHHVEEFELSQIYDLDGDFKHDLSEEVLNDSERWCHTWSYDLPKLRVLQVGKGSHDFSSMNAPSLDKVFMYGKKITSFKGIGHAHKITISVDSYSSMEGLENSPIEEFDIYYNSVEGELPDLSLMPNLNHLKMLRIGPVLTDDHQKQLTNCSQIVRLEASSYKGDLRFLDGWDSLTELDLRNSGTLSGIEVVEALPNLKRIRLRGSEMKRNSWPKSLQAILDYMGTSC